MDIKQYRRLLLPCLVFGVSAIFSAQADDLVILHTNDTHSQIDPDSRGLGGVLRRKALIDSVRDVHDNVLLVDAGDMVQGTLYFTLFGGEVEAKLMNYLGYDIQILGNHEFDNGVDEVEKIFSKLNAEKLSTNYDLSATPLSKIFRPYSVREIDGKKIGFIAINLDPKGMIADKNSKGVVYLDAIKAANATAWHLRHNEKVDLVVALTHIGYSEDGLVDDLDLAASSEDIDIIIGGHTHTVIDPQSDEHPDFLVDNAVGRPVLIAQTGKSGVNVGEIVIDLDDLSYFSRLLPVDSRYDKASDDELEDILSPYRSEVEFFRNYKIAKSPGLTKDDWSLVNWMADFVKEEGSRLAGKKVDLAIVNKGGVRTDMPKGDVTKGTIMQIFPFDNRIVVVRMKGADLRNALDVMAARGGDGVSKGTDVTFDASTGKTTGILINGKELDPEKEYLVATIDYLARGGDYMTPMTKGETVAESPEIIYETMIDCLQNRKTTIKADRILRMHK